MTTSGRTSFLEESDEKWSEAERIRGQSKLALVPCLRCSRASEKCWVGADSKKCAYCTENVMLCTVNPDKYRHVDNAKAIVAGTQPTHRVSPEIGSEEAYKEEAERLYALNPSWHIQEAETKISSLQPSAAKLSRRKRTGKHIRDERILALTPCLRPSRAAVHRRLGIKAENRAYCTGQKGKRKKKSKGQTVVGKNHGTEPIKPKFRPHRGISKPVDVLQGKCPITPKKVKQEPREAEIGEGLEVTSGSEYQPDSDSESPLRITAERESVESSDGGQDQKEDEDEDEEEEEEEEEQRSPGSSEELAALRREVIEMRREMKEMRKELRKGLERILNARKQQPHKGEIDIINLGDD